MEQSFYGQPITGIRTSPMPLCTILEKDCDKNCNRECLNHQQENDQKNGLFLQSSVAGRFGKLEGEILGAGDCPEGYVI